MKNMKYNIEESDEERKVYEELFEKAVTLIQDHSAELVAGSLMAIAQRLYKTHLSEPDYKRLMDYMTTVEIEPYEFTKERLH
jgi:hypothetical protein|tara:strand:+ start:34 stop:279 length:246 start_codon:yes stop_codon:yes gene_type:complete